MPGTARTPSVQLAPVVASPSLIVQNQAVGMGIVCVLFPAVCHTRRFGFAPSSVRDCHTPMKLTELLSRVCAVPVGAAGGKQTQRRLPRWHRGPRPVLWAMPSPATTLGGPCRPLFRQPALPVGLFAEGPAPEAQVQSQVHLPDARAPGQLA